MMNPVSPVTNSRMSSSQSEPWDTLAARLYLVARLTMNMLTP